MDSVRQAISDHGERYLERVYTDRELGDCRAEGGIDAVRLAARFAAKEATLKVLRTQAGLSPREIEVARSPEGFPALRLLGQAAEIASEQGLTEFALSISHEGDLACAVVVADAEGAPTAQGAPTEMPGTIR